MNATARQTPRWQNLYEPPAGQISGDHIVRQHREADTLAHGLLHRQRCVQRDAGMDGHIAKPLDIPHLLQVLADVLKS